MSVHRLLREAELGSQTRVDRETVEHEFIDRLFAFWDTSYRGSLSLQVRKVHGLDSQRAINLALGSSFGTERSDVQ